MDKYQLILTFREKIYCLNAAKLFKLYELKTKQIYKKY